MFLCSRIEKSLKLKCHSSLKYRNYCQPKSPIVDFVNTFGLGAEEGSSEWRDKKLELKVAGLFKQTIELAQIPGAQLHPKDVLIQQRAEEARDRIADRLHDMRLKDPERFAEIYDMVFSGIQGRIQEEQKDITSGSVPGTLTPPWQKGGLVWKSFFDDHLEDIMVNQAAQAESVTDVIYEDDTTYTENKLPSRASMEPNEKYPWLPAPDPNEKLEQLEDPKAWEVAGKKKKFCIFCSPERHQFPLEPMNVNLLLRFMNPSGFIKPRKKTGLCRTMQARVARTIKHARNIGVFSYRKGVFSIQDPTSEVKTEYERRKLQQERAFEGDGEEFFEDEANAE